MTYTSVVDDIKQKIDIVELVGSYVSLKRAGKYFKAPCPFHQEKTPSFVVSPDIGRWHCFGACHEGGDIFSFVMKWENITFAEALRMLAERAGVTLPENTQKAGYQDEESGKKEIIFSINELAMRYYHHVLAHTAVAGAARSYLDGRAISSKIIDTFQLGYAPEGWSNLVDYLSKKGIASADMELTGLCVTGSRGLYDRFRGRLMFPIRNTRGQVLGFSGRLIKENPSEKDGGKYINTPETLVYHKRESLFGFFQSKDDIRAKDTAVIVEGEFDMIVPYEKGFTNFVAIKGSAFTREQLQVLRRYCSRLILALDNDPAGFDALKKAVRDAEEFGFDVYVCAMPGGKDPDEAVRADAVAFKKALQDAPPVYDYLIDHLFSTVNTEDSYSKSRFAQEISPYIRGIANPIVRTHYVQKLATLLHTTPESITAMMQDQNKTFRKPEKDNQDDSKSSFEPDRPTSLAMKFLALLLSGTLSSDIRSQIFVNVQPVDLPDGPYRALFEKYKMYHEDESAQSIRFVSTLSHELRGAFDELFMFASTLDQADGKYALRLGLELRKSRITRMIQELADAKEEGTDDTLSHLATDRIAVEKQLALL